MHNSKINTALHKICKLMSVSIYEVLDAQNEVFVPLAEPLVSVPLNEEVDLFDEQKKLQ
jgi:hypothetical protein